MSESSYAIPPTSVNGAPVTTVKNGAAADGLSIPAVPEASAADRLQGPGQAGTRAEAKAGWRSSRLLWAVSFPAMLGAFLVLRGFYSMRQFFVDPDVWWHIKTGALILQTHHWPTTDPYSFTVAGQPWMSCEWLGDALLAVISRTRGTLALDIYLIGLASAILIALYYYGTLRSGNCKAGFVAAALLSPLAIMSCNLRPQMLGYLFLILTMIALEFFRQGKHRAIWFLPPLMLMWINTHGSWIIGLGAIFVYWIAGLKELHLGGIEAKPWTPSERKKISFAFLLCLAVLPITPYGTQLAVYPFNMAFSQPINVANVLEWQPMPFNETGGKLFLAILIGFVILQVIYRLSWRLEEFALFLFGTTMACLHVRMILVFVPFCVPLLASIFARWIPRYSRAKEHYALNLLLILGVAVGMFWYRPTRDDVQAKMAKQYPVYAVKYIRHHPVPAPLYNNYGFGGYLIESLPNYKTLIDGRGDLFERAGVFADYMAISRLKPAGLFLLDSYGFESCLIYRTEPLATVLSASTEWKQVYSDPLAVIFVRRDDRKMITRAKASD